MSNETVGKILVLLVISPGILAVLLGQWVYRKRSFFSWLSLMSSLLGMTTGMTLTFSLTRVLAYGPWVPVTVISNQLLCVSLSWWLVHRLVHWYDNTMAEYRRNKELANSTTPAST